MINSPIYKIALSRVKYGETIVISDSPLGLLSIYEDGRKVNNLWIRRSNMGENFDFILDSEKDSILDSLLVS